MPASIEEEATREAAAKVALEALAKDASEETGCDRLGGATRYALQQTVQATSETDVQYLASASLPDVLLFPKRK